MLADVLRVLGTVSTLVFAVSAIRWAAKHPASGALPVWSWPLLVLGSVLLPIGNEGYARSLFLVVTGGVLIVAFLQIRGRVGEIWASPKPSVTREVARPRAKIHRPEDAVSPNWKAEHQEPEDGASAVILWVRSLDVSLLLLRCEVQEPDGNVVRDAGNYSNSPAGRFECTYPYSFYGEWPSPIADGKYNVKWSSSGGNLVARDEFEVEQGSLKRPKAVE